MIPRKHYLKEIKRLLETNPVVALVGARQVGKTTLANEIANLYSKHTFFDLENPAHLARLSDPLLALQNLQGLVIIDEIQHQPNLFKILRVLADRKELPCRFLVLGSASPILLKQSAESLAGRIAYLEIHGFNLTEVGITELNRLWIRGAFPKAFIAKNEMESFDWRQNFVRTFLERDLPQLGITIPFITMRRFWMMIAHYHGQIWNSSEFARAFGMSDHTVKNYLDILTSTFVIRQLTPWWENISKRQIKAPKVYIYDSGILHALLGLNDQEQVENHVKVGASWEGFAMNNVLARLNIPNEEAFYWGTHAGAEIDLVIMHGNHRLGFEFKRTTTPQITRSIYTAAEDLKLTHIYIIHAGTDTFQLSANITALSIHRLLQDLDPFL